MIESLDKSVGAILAAIRDCDLERNTMVIFTSDNGGYLTYNDQFNNISSNGRLRGQKTQLCEGGHRVPTIVSWPGRIRPGVTDEIGHSTDLLPTVASLAGVRSDRYDTDGVDLGPLLFHRKPLPNRMLFWRADSEWAVRHGEWKLYAEESQTELYNLDDDLGERRDRAAENPTLVRELKDAWRQWEVNVNTSAKAHEEAL